MSLCLFAVAGYAKYLKFVYGNEEFSDIAVPVFEGPDRFNVVAFNAKSAYQFMATVAFVLVTWPFGFVYRVKTGRVGKESSS